MSTITRTYRGISAEQRRAERREKLIEAGLDVLGTQGWRATTMTAVCNRAGLTERYFYESFTDKEALLVAVTDHVAGQAARVVLEAVETAPRDARATARAAIGAFVELLTEDPRKGRVALLAGAGGGELARRRQETLHSFALLVAEQMRHFYGPRAPSRKNAELTAHMLVGGLAEALIAWLDGSLDVSPRRLVQHSAEMFVAAAGVSSR